MGRGVLRKSVQMRYAFIRDNQHIWSIRRLCSTLDVHHSGYYAWLKQPISRTARKRQHLSGLIKQLCVIHQIRNSIRYVASRDQKAFMRDLKPVYKAVNKDSAELALDELDRLWGSKYPAVIASWRDKWHLLSAYFKYPDAVRKPIYTTNAVEAVHRQFRKLTKTKGAFPNETSLLKLLYVGMLNASEKWTMPINNWGQTMMQLSIHFPGRLDAVMSL